jgi:hypothetical protein
MDWNIKINGKMLVDAAETALGAAMVAGSAAMAGAGVAAAGTGVGAPLGVVVLAETGVVLAMGQYFLSDGYEQLKEDDREAPRQTVTLPPPKD